MIKVKLYELDKHRNECTFRPYLYARHVLEDIGIEFTTSNSYDFAWIAQASFIDKQLPLNESVEKGLEFLSKITGDYILIDGQDSTSLIGSYEVFKQSQALLLLKTSLLSNRALYTKGWQLGRQYWGSGEYRLDDFESYSNRIMLSGTNWLSTHWAGINHQWYNEYRIREYDVCAMFQYPSSKVNYEHGHEQTVFYDKFRKNAIDALNNMKCKVAKLENGNRVSLDEYYNKMYNSRVVVAPYGYGEMAPRDLETMMFGNVLIKPDMSGIDTAPNIFIDGETYIACAHDFSNLAEKIDEILDDTEKYYYIANNARKVILDQMQPSNLAYHMYNVIQKLPGVTC
jgi:hypothetical protein